MKLFFGPGKSKPVVSAIDVQGYLRDEIKYQYQDGYSMAQAAKCWIAAAGLLPNKIATVVGNDDLISAHFEFPTPVWGGGIAMTDVMAFLPDGIIAVEAKVNEPFDDIVSVWITRQGKKNSNSPAHRQKVIGKYAEALCVAPEQLSEIRYQLLQRTLSAALTARSERKSQAWMIVQSFGNTHSDGHRRNRADFDSFRNLVGSAPKIEGQRVQLDWVDASGG
jgi:hypothetical protein